MIQWESRISTSSTIKAVRLHVLTPNSNFHGTNRGYANTVSSYTCLPVAIQSVGWLISALLAIDLVIPHQYSLICSNPHTCMAIVCTNMQQNPQQQRRLCYVPRIQKRLPRATWPHQLRFKTLTCTLIKECLEHCHYHLLLKSSNVAVIFCSTCLANLSAEVRDSSWASKLRGGISQIAQHQAVNCEVADLARRHALQNLILLKRSCTTEDLGGIMSCNVQCKSFTRLESRCFWQLFYH